MLDRESMVRTWSFEQLLEVVWGALDGLLTPLALGGSHERALTPLLVLLLARTVASAFTSVLVLLSLAFEAVKNCPDRLLA